MGILAAGASVLSGCAGSGDVAGVTEVNPEGEVVGREISWLNSRPADGPTLKVVQELADEFAQEHPGFKLTLINTPDRPSYLQRMETLAAANQLPELVDTDATPYAQLLADQGKLLNTEELLKDMGEYDNFREGALNYQRFDDGSLYTIPLEFQAEMFWYNKGMFEEAGIEPPTDLREFPEMCRALRDIGVTPFALNGQDQWPVERFVLYLPFRLGGPDYLNELKKGERDFSDEIGQETVQWLAELSDAGCFDSGFSATGYADAQAMFTNGKAAIWGTGTWDLGSLATKDLPEDMQNEIAYFTLPGVEGAVTELNEYVAPSGIGMAVTTKTYDPLVRAWL